MHHLRTEADLDTALACLVKLDPRFTQALALSALHGIGPWTADIYLLFCLGHADAWPAGDLALQEAARLLLSLKARPTAKEMGPLAEPWRPWRGAAACALWAYYRAMKKREGALTTNAAQPKLPRPGRSSPRKRRPR